MLPAVKSLRKTSGRCPGSEEDESKADGSSGLPLAFKGICFFFPPVGLGGGRGKGEIWFISCVGFQGNPFYYWTHVFFLLV